MENLERESSRIDVNYFTEYVFGWKQGEHHQEWHSFIDQNDRAVIWAPVEHGKSSQLLVARPLFELGGNPELHTALISNTSSQAKKFLSSIRDHIERDERLCAVFPNLEPAELWTSTEIKVKRQDMGPDPSIQALGVFGPILGARLHRIYMDDILDFMNTLTEGQRLKVIDWIKAEVLGRLLPGGKLVLIGTAWHPQDAMHHFAEISKFKWLRQKAIDKGKILWPEQWPAERLQDKKDELGSLEFSRQMLNVARDDSTSRFKSEWIQKSLDAGRGTDFLQQYTPQQGERVYTGWDLGVAKEGELTVGFDLLIKGNGMRQVLNIDAGNFTGPDIVSRIKDHHTRYHSIQMVENNAAQDYIVQFTREGSAVPVKAFTTGRQKADPTFGVESLAVELENGKWIIPAKADGSPANKEIQAWINEMLYYNPEGHTGDRLMASWFAREAARKTSKVKSKGVPSDGTITSGIRTQEF